MMFRLHSAASIQRPIANVIAQKLDVLGSQQEFAPELQNASEFSKMDEGHSHSDKFTNSRRLSTSTVCETGDRSVVVLNLCKLQIVSLQRRYFSTSQKHWSVHVDPKKDYYKALGVSPQCSVDKVKNAYYRLTKLYHPDVNKAPHATKKFHDITEAYEVLSNTRLRRQYEEGRKHQVHGHHHFGQVSRGQKPFHSKHFKPTGPIQAREHQHHGHDSWVQKHYKDALMENHDIILEAEEKRRYQKSPKRVHEEHEKMQKNHPRHENALMHFCIAWLVIVVLGCIVKFTLSRSDNKLQQSILKGSEK